MIARIRQAFRGTWTAMICGALFCLPLGRLVNAGHGENFIGRIIITAIFGLLCGLVILGAIRLFRTARWGYLIAGPLAGTLPIVVMVPSKTSQDDFGGLWLLSAILGLFIGLLEWQRTSAKTKLKAGASSVED
jgi:hypothetical protein